MTRAKMRKAIAEFPDSTRITPVQFKTALGVIHNDRTRQRVESRIRRRDGAR